ncbi:MAG: GatB/YqeY domain-containing protein, partial [Flavobacteriales bacterium]
MSLTDQINNDLKEAMKAKDTVRLTALRSVKSQLLLAATEKGAEGE